jgi:methionyl-tRNA formyltransferase
MRIVLLCATRRGYRFLERLTKLSPDAEIIVFTFREELWEPPFLDDIRELTLAHGGRFFEARQVGASAWESFWKTTPVDVMFAVSWRYMIPAEVFRRPRRGTFVFHDAMLPRYRGFAPTVWAIINGEHHTGVTLFEIAEDFDSGDIVDQQAVSIGPDDTIAVVMERVTEGYLNVLTRNLQLLLNGNAPRRPQDHSLATYTCRRLPDDNGIDWTASSETIYNLIRAVSSPYPGAYTYLEGRRIRVWSARRLPSAHAYVGRIPGRVVEVRRGEGAVVLTGDGALLLRQVQQEGDEIVRADDVLNSQSQTLGR